MLAELQIILYIPVLDPIFHLRIFAAVQDIAPLDGAKPPFRPLAFILIDEVSVLKGNLFAAVFDFKDLTGVFFLVIDDHVKLASLKLQFETR